MAKRLVDDTVVQAAANTIEHLLNATAIVHLLRDAPTVNLDKPEDKKEGKKKEKKKDV